MNGPHRLFVVPVDVKEACAANCVWNSEGQSHELEQFQQKCERFCARELRQNKAIEHVNDQEKNGRALSSNPCAGIDRLKAGNSFHTSTLDEVTQYEARHPAGTKARLALHLGLFTGLRLSDIAVVGRQHIKDGWLKIRPGKTASSSGVTVEIPVLHELQETIDATETGDLSFLVTDWGRPFSVDGLGNKMRQWCNQAGLFHCTMYGLRKAGATIAAENGATDDELMAIFGWTTKQQTTLYTRQASRKKLAGGAMHKLRPEQKRDKIVPPTEGGGKGGTKTRKKSFKING